MAKPLKKQIAVSIAHMKNSLSKYLDLAEKGQEVVITKFGKPAFKVTALKEIPLTFQENGTEIAQFYNTIEPIEPRGKGKTALEMLLEEREES